jgi:hypothetical protein
MLLSLQQQKQWHPHASHSMNLHSLNLKLYFSIILNIHTNNWHN